MEDLLIATLSKLGYPVMLQGSLLSDEPYPDSFFTFWEDESEEVESYNNRELLTAFSYSINFYSTDQEKVYTAVREAITLLRTADFITSGAGYSVPSGNDTHDARGFEVKYLKNN